MRVIFREPGFPLPSCVSPSLPAKFGARAQTGDGGEATGRPPPGPGGGSGTPEPSLPQPPSFLRRGRIRLLAAGVRRLQHPLPTFRSSWQEQLPRRAGSAPSPEAVAGQEGGRRGPAAQLAAREAAPGGRRPAQPAGERSVLPGALPARARAGSRLAARGCGGFLNDVQGARGALLLLLLFLTPPSSHPCAPVTWEPLANLAQLGLHAGRASGWTHGRRGRSRVGTGGGRSPPREPCSPGPVRRPLFRAPHRGPPSPGTRWGPLGSPPPPKESGRSSRAPGG